MEMTPPPGLWRVLGRTPLGPEWRLMFRTWALTLTLTVSAIRPAFSWKELARWSDGCFQLPSSASLLGRHRNVANGPSGAGSQFASLALPGDFFRRQPPFPEMPLTYWNGPRAFPFGG
jgi:hypothetical protein